MIKVLEKKKKLKSERCTAEQVFFGGLLASDAQIFARIQSLLSYRIQFWNFRVYRLTKT
jgi:hypothetical protein